MSTATVVTVAPGFFTSAVASTDRFQQLLASETHDK